MLIYISSPLAIYKDSVYLLNGLYSPEVFFRASSPTRTCRSFMLMLIASITGDKGCKVWDSQRQVTNNILARAQSTNSTPLRSATAESVSGISSGQGSPKQGSPKQVSDHHHLSPKKCHQRCILQCLSASRLCISPIGGSSYGQTAV
jgi:hypothetical protein